MENRKVLLCPAGCGACPEVEFAEEEVRVGEPGNVVVLTKDQWNVLVDLIRSGVLTKVRQANAIPSTPGNIGPATQCSGWSLQAKMTSWGKPDAFRIEVCPY